MRDRSRVHPLLINRYSYLKYGELRFHLLVEDGPAALERKINNKRPFVQV